MSLGRKLLNSSKFPSHLMTPLFCSEHPIFIYTILAIAKMFLQKTCYTNGIHWNDRMIEYWVKSVTHSSRKEPGEWGNPKDLPNVDFHWVKWPRWRNERWMEKLYIYIEVSHDKKGETDFRRWIVISNLSTNLVKTLKAIALHIGKQKTFSMPIFSIVFCPHPTF